MYFSSWWRSTLVCIRSAFLLSNECMNVQNNFCQNILIIRLSISGSQLWRLELSCSQTLGCYAAMPTVCQNCIDFYWQYRNLMRHSWLICCMLCSICGVWRSFAHTLCAVKFHRGGTKFKGNVVLGWWPQNLRAAAQNGLGGCRWATWCLCLAWFYLWLSCMLQGVLFPYWIRIWVSLSEGPPK